MWLAGENSDIFLVPEIMTRADQINLAVCEVLGCSEVQFTQIPNPTLFIQGAVSINMLMKGEFCEQIMAI